jgi:hypothetical protein
MEEAVNLCSKAAAQGLPEAEAWLGAAYFYARGVSFDIETSYMWALLARLGGSLRGHMLVPQIEAALTPEQRARGQKRAGVLHLARERKEELLKQKIAASPTKLTTEFRQSQEINPNQMVNEFLSNRVDVTIRATSRGLFGASDRTKSTSTLLARDVTGVYALLHVTDTPFTISKPATGLDKISTTVSKRNRDIAFRPLEFLAADPRILAVPVSETVASLSGIKIYNLAANPFRFPEAVLIGKGGRYFGEAEFKLDPSNPNFVKVKGGFFKALRGEFSPSSGDLVLSKSGELLA